MTKARALQLLAELVGDDPDYGPALEALRPKARKAKTGAVSPAVREILRNLKRPDGFGLPTNEQVAYLDTFGAPGTPERQAQALRVAAMIDGPSREAYGCPESVAWVAASGGYDWQDEDKRRAALRVLVDAWRYTEQGQAFEQAKAAHEARRAQFAYAPPRTRKDDERRTFALAVLDRTTIETESLAATAA